MSYPIVKALHVISFTCWFAALLYLGRLLVYHVEALDREPAEREILTKQFAVMQQRLLKYIASPAMLATIFFGLWLIGIIRGMKLPWLHVKLTLIVFLIGYHHMCKSIMRKLASGSHNWTSKKLRIFNEVGTVLLIAIVYLAVTKQIGLALLATVITVLVIGVLMMIAVKLRGKKGDIKKAA